MNNHSKSSQVFRFLKLFFACFLCVGFLVFFAILLRAICTTPTHASEKSYVYITSPTTLYSSNELKDEIITIPEGYYAEVISSTSSLAKVQYNSVTGFINISNDAKLTSSPTEPYFQTAEIKTKADAGTYLRTRPSTASTSLAIVPPDAELTFIGEIAGERPTDGTSENWFYVHYNLSDTIVHTGYIYSERITIVSGKLDRPVASTTPSSSSNDLSTEPSDTPLVLTEPLSAGVKIFLGILFSTLGIIIFALLIISPREKKDDLNRPRVHGEKEAKKHENTGFFDDFTPKNSKNTPFLTNFTPKTHQNTKNTPKNASYTQKNGEKTTKIGTINHFSPSKIPPQTATEEDFMQKSNTNQNSIKSASKPQPARTTEYASFQDFTANRNHHTQPNSVPSRRLTRNKELTLMGEKNGSMPKALTRYFDIE